MSNRTTTETTTNYKKHEFYKARREAVEIAIENKLPSSCWCLWSYLQLLDPFGKRNIDLPNPEELSHLLGLSLRQIKRAMARLQLLELWDFNCKSLKGRNPYGDQAPKNDGSTKILPMTKLSDDGQNCHDDGQNCHDQNSETAPDNGSNSPKIHKIHKINKTLSDPEETEATLNVESTKIIDSEEREKKNELDEEKDLSAGVMRDRHKELAKKVNQHLDSQGDRQSSRENESISVTQSNSKISAESEKPNPQPQIEDRSANNSADVLESQPANSDRKQTSRPSLKNSVSDKKGCDGLCSIEEILGDTLLPRTREELKKTYQFGDEECEEFEEFTKNKASQYREKVVVLDDWAMAKLKSILAEYASWKRQKIAIERRRAEIEKQSHSERTTCGAPAARAPASSSREPVAQEPPSEPENPDKPKKTMKEIAAEIRRKRDEKLLAENPKEYKRRMKWRNL